jgi:hypothetical protein
LKIYADPSFIVSLYSPDANSIAAARSMQAFSGERFLTTFGELEVVNAMGLRIFRKEVLPAQAQSSLLEFENDLRDGVFQLRGLPDSILERARQLSRQTTPKLGNPPQICCTWQPPLNSAWIPFTASTTTSENLPNPFGSS